MPIPRKAADADWARIAAILGSQRPALVREIGDEGLADVVLEASSRPSRPVSVTGRDRRKGAKHGDSQPGDPRDLLLLLRVIDELAVAAGTVLVNAGVGVEASQASTSVLRSRLSVTAIEDWLVTSTRAAPTALLPWAANEVACLGRSAGPEDVLDAIALTALVSTGGGEAVVSYQAEPSPLLRRLRPGTARNGPTPGGDRALADRHDLSFDIHVGTEVVGTFAVKGAMATRAARDATETLAALVALAWRNEALLESSQRARRQLKSATIDQHNALSEVSAGLRGFVGRAAPSAEGSHLMGRVDDLLARHGPAEPTPLMLARVAGQIAAEMSGAVEVSLHHAGFIRTDPHRSTGSCARSSTPFSSRAARVVRPRSP